MKSIEIKKIKNISYCATWRFVLQTFSSFQYNLALFLHTISYSCCCCRCYGLCCSCCHHHLFCFAIHNFDLFSESPYAMSQCRGMPVNELQKPVPFRPGSCPVPLFHVLFRLCYCSQWCLLLISVMLALPPTPPPLTPPPPQPLSMPPRPSLSPSLSLLPLSSLILLRERKITLQYFFRWRSSVTKKRSLSFSSCI